MGVPSARVGERVDWRHVEIDAVREVAWIEERAVELHRQELIVLEILLQERGRVVGRAELARRAGLRSMSPRQCDKVLFRLRQALGAESIRSVRGRGWMLDGPMRTAGLE